MVSLLLCLLADPIDVCTAGRRVLLLPPHVRMFCFPPTPLAEGTRCLRNVVELLVSEPFLS